MQSVASSDSDYYTRLGLECDPFAVDAMPDFFFVGAQRRFLVQRAVHALYFSGATVLLLGADGVGKTRTLDEIEKELKDLADICRIEATVLMDAAEIRGLLAAALGLPSAVAAGNIELVHALERVCPADGDPQPVLIAIDAAQFLSTETLAECAALVAGGRLRLLLAGGADLAISWQQTQAGAAEVLELARLDRNETADYVRTKLQAAGSREEQALSDAQFDQLFAQSGGSFAAINALVPQFLQPAPQAVPTIQRIKVHPVTHIKTLPVLHIGIGAALLTVVILVALYRGGSNSHSSQTVQLLHSADSQAQQATVTKENVEQRTVALQLPQSTEAATNSLGATSSVSTSTENKRQEMERKSVVDKKEAENKTAVPEKVTAVERGETNEREKTKAENPVNKTIVTSTQSSSFEADESALLTFPSTHYVLQLLGTELKVGVDKFTDGAGKGLRLYCYRTQLRGKPWLVVVTGPYPDRAAALSAVAQMPEAVRQGNPWPRTLANVQADIRAHRDSR